MTPLSDSGPPSPGQPAPSVPSPEALGRLARGARRAALRLRVNQALETAVRWSPLPLVVAIGAIAYVKLAQPPESTKTVLASVVLAAALVVGVLCVLAFRRGGRAEAGALALDRYHGMEDRLTSALGFSKRLADEAPGAGQKERLERALMQLAITDALAQVPKLEPGRAVPLRVPGRWQLPVLLAIGLSMLSVLEVQRPTVATPEAAPLVDRVALFEDDVRLLRDVGEELEKTSQTPEALADIREFNRLVEDLAAERLDRREAFARLDALEREIRGSARELEALEEGLEELAQELERAALSRAAGEALADKRLADAEQALRQLAERLRRQEEPPTQAELEQLRTALQKASEVSQSRRAQSQSEAGEQGALQAERKRLLQKKQAGNATSADLDRLASAERALQRLGRDKQQGDQGRDAASEQLSELDRKLAEAARELAEAQGKGKASEFMDQSAESVSRMKQKQLSQKEKEQLLERMREMRDMLRQQKGGEQQKEWAERMRRLQRKAQGRGQEGQEGQEDKSGSGKPGERQPGGVTLGADGMPIPMAGSERPGQGPGQPGEGQEPGGSGPAPGSGHDPNVQGETPSSADGKTQDVMAVAPDTGQGTASSEVIYSAAERGFTSGEYNRIFTDYITVAEDVIEREDIPPGYRSHVRRYFQLIRPRE